MSHNGSLSKMVLLEFFFETYQFHQGSLEAAVQHQPSFALHQFLTQSSSSRR